MIPNLISRFFVVFISTIFISSSSSYAKCVGRFINPISDAEQERRGIYERKENDEKR